MKTLWMLACACSLGAQSYTISTNAGGAPPPTPIQATALALPQFGGVTAANGNIYFTAANTLLQVDNAGVMTRLAGNGRTAGNSSGIPPAGASVPALSAQFSWAQSVTVDRSGNFYIVDAVLYNGGGQPTFVWKLTPDGQMRIAAKIADGGNGVRVAIATDPSGALYVTDNGVVYQVASDGSLTAIAGIPLSIANSGDGGPALQATLGGVTSIAFDASGNLYVSSSDFDENGDLTNGRVRVVTPDRTIHAFAGTGVAGYSGDGGPASAAQLGNACLIWLDGAGDVFIADPSNNALREVTPDGNIATVFTPPPSGSVATVDDAGHPYLTHLNLGVTFSYLLSRRERDGSLTPIAGGGGYIGDGGAASAATLSGPQGVAVDAAHNTYIDDQGQLLIRRITADGIISTIAGNGSRRLAGDEVLEGVPAVTAPLFCPCQGLAADRSGNVFFTEWDRVRKISPDGILTTAAAVPALGLAYDGAALYIADSQESRVWKLAADGTLIPFAGNGTQGHSGDGGSALNAQLQYPGDVAVDGLGNVYIAEYLTSWGGWIRKVTPDGTITTVTLDRDLNGIAADGAGSVYALDFMRGEVRKLAADGTWATIAGGVCYAIEANSCWGYSGDGGPAASAQMNAPARIAIDASGVLFVADSQNNAIRTIAPAASPSSGH